MPWLRELGYRAEDVRAAAALCEHMPGAPLEQRVKMALRHFHPRTTSPGRAARRQGTAA